MIRRSRCAGCRFASPSTPPPPPPPLPQGRPASQSWVHVRPSDLHATPLLCTPGTRHVSPLCSALSSFIPVAPALLCPLPFIRTSSLAPLAPHSNDSKPFHVRPATGGPLSVRTSSIPHCDCKAERHQEERSSGEHLCGNWLLRLNTPSSPTISKQDTGWPLFLCSHPLTIRPSGYIGSLHSRSVSSCLTH